MYVIPTTKAEHIARILQKKGMNVIFASKNKDDKSQFPDGELYTRIKEVERLAGERVVVLHSGQPDPNSGLVELYNVLEILNNPVASAHIKDKEYSYRQLKKPASVEVFFLYFPYGMQDKVFDTGECNMAESIVRKLVSYYNVSKIYALDPHFEGAIWAKKYPISVVKAVDAINDALLADGVTDAVKVAPDLGSQSRLDIGGFLKKRMNSFDVELSNDSTLEDKVKGKTAVVWDDLIETGGTMSKAGKALSLMGAKKVVAVATHGVLERGIKRIMESYSKLYLTNSIDGHQANVDVSGIVMKAISE
ncbi:MAG: phosphoribosyltransferase family protein [archaeon]